MTLIKFNKPGFPWITEEFPNWLDSNDIFADDFFTRDRKLPAMNIKETKETFEIELSVPGFTKKEITLLTKEQEKLNRNFSGIRAMRKLPGLLIVVDPNKEHIAVAEANKLGIPVMALVDTNCDPDPIDYVIACNDDALKSIKLIIQAISDAVIDKKSELSIAIGKEDALPENEEKVEETAEEESKGEEKE